MVLIYTLGDLGAPLIVGGGYKVFASEIYTNFISNWGDKRIPMVFALWTVLIFSAILVLLVQLKQARLARPAQSPGIAAGASLSAQVRRVGSVLMSLLTLVLLLPFINLLLATGLQSLLHPAAQGARAFPIHDFRPVWTTFLLALFSVPPMIAGGILIAHTFKSLRHKGLAMSLLLLGVVEATLALASRALQRADRRQAGLGVAHPLFEAPQARVAETAAVQPSVFLSAFTAVQPEPEAERRANVRAGGSVIERLVRRGRAFAAGLKNRRGGGMRSGGFSRSSRSALDALQAENLDLRRKLALAEQKSLRMQINPHFFFNTLNTIVSLLRLDPAAAAETIGKLSSLFRYTLDASEEQAMFLPKEIEYIRTYLEIEKLRFGDALVFSIDVPDELYSLQVPPQRLAEALDRIRKLKRVSAATPASAGVEAPAGVAVPEKDLAALVEFFRSRQSYASRLTIKNEFEYLVISVFDISCVRVEDGLVFVYSRGLKYRIETPLKKLEERLDPAVFLRIHRAVLVNKNHIKRIFSPERGRFAVETSDRLILPVSRDYLASFKTAMGF